MNSNKCNCDLIMDFNTLPIQSSHAHTLYIHRVSSVIFHLPENYSELAGSLRTVALPHVNHESLPTYIFPLQLATTIEALQLSLMRLPSLK